MKDTGTGIDPEIFPVLFSKFATKSETAGTGTGLGLLMSKSILEAHGEDNTYESGATFGFSLPINKQHPEAAILEQTIG